MTERNLERLCCKFCWKWGKCFFMDQHVQRSTVNFTRFAESHLRVPFPRRWKFSFTFGCRWLIKMLTFVWIVEIILVLVFTNLYRRTLRKTNDRVVYSLITIQHWTGVVSRNWLILGIFNKFFFKITFTFEHRLKWTHGYMDVLGLQWQGPPLS